MVREYEHDSANPSRFVRVEYFEGLTQVVLIKFIARWLDFIGDNVISLLPRRGSCLVATPPIPRYRSTPSSNGIGLLSSGLDSEKYDSTAARDSLNLTRTTANVPTSSASKPAFPPTAIKARDLVFTRSSR
jgi:hypothetical protein